MCDIPRTRGFAEQSGVSRIDDGVATGWTESKGVDRVSASLEKGRSWSNMWKGVSIAR